MPTRYAGSIVALVLLASAFPAPAAQRARAGADRAPRARVSLGAVSLDVAVVAPDTVRVRVAPNAVLDGPDFSYAVRPEALAAAPAGRSTVPPGSTPIVVSGTEVSATITREAGRPVRLTIRDAKGEVVVDDAPTAPVSVDEARGAVTISKAHPRDEMIYGFGEKAMRLERSSQAIANWNTDAPAYTTGTDPLYQTVPFYVALRAGKAYGLFFDNTYRSFFDVAKRDPDRITFGAAGGWADYYVMAGGADRDPRKVIGRYTELTGRTELPPLWALGYQQSRWSYFPESRVRELASAFRRFSVPCDAVYLDIHYMDGYRVFTWDRERFPDPRRLVADLDAMGIKMVVIIDPGIKVDPGYAVYTSGRDGGHYVRTATGEEFQGKVWPGVCAFPDYTSPEARRWWGAQFRDLVATGIAGFWVDMNEPAVFQPDNFVEPWVQHHPFKTFPLDARHAGDGQPGPHARFHNVYGQQMARATRDGVLALAPDRRPFVLTRASYAGGQRYSASWTGDNAATWEHLQISIPMLLGMGISGQALVGADVGGFVGAPSGELYTRWLQAAALTPLLRSHTDFDSPDQEPWSYGPDLTVINRRTIELRYRLMPYLYGVFAETAQTGLPAMRPMWLDFRDDVRTYLVNDQYMVGADLLVAPVVDPGRTSRRVYLPAGATWVDWYTGEIHEGGRDVTVPAPLDRLPLFVRGGAVVPMREVAENTRAQLERPLVLRVFPGGRGEARVYEDAGEGYGYQRGQYSVTVVSHDAAAGARTVALGKRDGAYKPRPTTIEVELVAAPGEALRPDARRGTGQARAGRDASGLRFVSVTVPNDGAARTLAVARAGE